MTDYTELVKALRYCSKASVSDCIKCPGYLETGDCVSERLAKDAAAAIEELQAEVDELKQKNTDLLNVREVSNDEMERILEVLRNIPVGPIESIVEQMPKRGQWKRVEDGESYHYECTRCGERPLYTAYGHIVLSGTCPNCGAKMEVQE